MNFSENFKTALENNNISQRQMSKDTGISQGLISAWARGEKKPGIENLCEICLYLHESADTLLGIDKLLSGGGAE